MSPLRFKIRNRDGKLVASCETRDDALAICRRHGIGAKISHRDWGQLWTEPVDGVSFHCAGDIIQRRIAAKQAAFRATYEAPVGSDAR
jgi:hypothetical protein